MKHTNNQISQRLALAAGLAMSLSACLEPSREDQRDAAAGAYCERLDACGDIGAGERYASADDCAVAQRDLFNDLWPADKCSDGRINEERYDACVDKLRGVECNMNIFDVVDLAKFAADCNAGEVCIDPAD